jgi:anti-sigma B factor antagonist
VAQTNFHLDVQGDEHAIVVAVSGELDLASSPALRQQLERASQSGAELVVLDLRELAFMDSTGLSVLVKAQQQAAGAGHRFAVVKGGKQVQRLLSLTGVAAHLTLVDEPDELMDIGPTGSPR